MSWLLTPNVMGSASCGIQTGGTPLSPASWVLAHKAIVRTDAQALLGVVVTRYKPVQTSNSQLDWHQGGANTGGTSGSRNRWCRSGVAEGHLGVRHGNLTGKITLCDPASTTNPQALPAGLSEWAILDSNQ